MTSSRFSGLQGYYRWNLNLYINLSIHIGVYTTYHTHTHKSIMEEFVRGLVYVFGDECVKFGKLVRRGGF